MKKIKNKRSARSTIKSIAIYAVIIISIVYLLPRILAFALGTSHPMAVVSSNSMWPTLTRGDLIFLQNVNKEDIRVGDVIGYYNGGAGFGIHRVVKVENGSIMTKGDANIVEDRPISYDYVVGKAVSINGWVVKIPYLGYISMAAEGELKS